jgi:CsbD-like
LELVNGNTRVDWNRIEGNWKQLKGQVKEKWGKLTGTDPFGPDTLSGTMV